MAEDEISEHWSQNLNYVQDRAMYRDQRIVNTKALHLKTNCCFLIRGRGPEVR